MCSFLHFGNATIPVFVHLFTGHTCQQTGPGSFQTLAFSHHGEETRRACQFSIFRTCSRQLIIPLEPIEVLVLLDTAD